ncbi:MAG: gamma-glutamyltransferase family protein [Proteobacteria bacterium]|nr:gamma-glutamyltransferase family protein [Pseudomonadota bacterium]MBI3497959.1 gamma-glutamyltransferase family protein [Pseudomonadota bacterium]
MIVAPQPDAVEAGALLYQAGGNAVDAVIGCAFAQCVVDQMMCGIAGFGVAQLYLPKKKTHEVVNFLSKAPLSVRPDMWADLFEYETRDGFGFVLKGRVNDLGYQSIAVPGSLKGFQDLHGRHGRLPWAQVIQPAIRLAEEGYRVTPAVHTYWTTLEGMGRVEVMERLRFTPACASLFFASSGAPHPIGTVVKNPDYGRTLRRIAAEGADSFYKGVLAEQIAADMERHGGRVARRDLETYMVDRGEPIWGEYRGHRVSVTQPASSGPMLLKMLHTLERFDLKGLGHNTPEYIQVVAEVMKRAGVVKDRLIGDPAFIQVPVERIIDRAAAAVEAEAIAKGERAHIARAEAKEAADTTHISALDAEGNAVTLTHSLGMQSGVITEGLGFMYNGAMAMFDPRPGHPQSLAPGKQRMSSMAPAIVFKGNEPYIVLGAPGGSSIPLGILQVILNAIDFGMPIVEAVSAPHFSATGNAIDVSARIPRTVCAALGRMGYQTIHSVQSFIAARVHAVMIENGRVTGAADPATGGMALAV